MSHDPQGNDVKYTRGQSATEEADQTRRMPRSRVRHGVIVSVIAIAVVILIVIFVAY